MKASWAVLSPMTQMIKLFAAASTQPSQHLLPTRMVEKIVRTQDKQSSRNTSESISSFISVIFPRIDLQVCISKLRWRNLRNRTPSLFVVSETPRPGLELRQSLNLPRRTEPDYWHRHFTNNSDCVIDWARISARSGSIPGTFQECAKHIGGLPSRPKPMPLRPWGWVSLGRPLTRPSLRPY